MKKKDWNEGLNHLDPDLVEEYVAQKDACAQKKRRMKPYWFAAVAAVLVLAICLSIFLGGNGIPGVKNPHLLAAPVYPQMVQKPNAEDYGNRWEAYDVAYKAWNTNQRQQYDQPADYADGLTAFFAASMAEFLQGSGNTTYSPVNVYMAMAMLAETTDGNSRQQILDLFGVETIQQLRQQASYVWNAHYSDDGETTLLLANSLWLDEAYSFHQNTTKLLADHYYASSFRGDLGTDTMNKQLQNWLDENTGGLLKEQAKEVELDPQTVFALASTIYFSAGWESKFNAASTKDAVFHLTQEDRTIPFMNKAIVGCTYYWSENFTAIYLELTGLNKMWLILPDEGYTTADILASDDYLRMTMNHGSWQDKKSFKVNLSLPKFDVVSQMDLIEGMKALGVTDIFDDTNADFSPLTDTTGLYVGQIGHAARVTIDEKGCRAAAFTVIAAPDAAPPSEWEEIDFVLDRPFLFVVSSRDNLPLFAGVVNEP